MGQHLPASTWDAIRVAWVTGCATQAKLAKQYGIPENTIQCRSKREKWGKTHQVMQKMAKDGAISQENALLKAQLRPALTAARLIQRTLDSSERRLAQLDKRMEADPTDANLARLVGAWSQVVKIARLTHGMDSAEAGGRPKMCDVIDAEIVDIPDAVLENTTTDSQSHD